MNSATWPWVKLHSHSIRQHGYSISELSAEYILLCLRAFTQDFRQKWFAPFFRQKWGLQPTKFRQTHNIKYLQQNRPCTWHEHDHWLRSFPYFPEFHQWRRYWSPDSVQWLGWGQTDDSHHYWCRPQDFKRYFLNWCPARKAASKGHPLDQDWKFKWALVRQSMVWSSHLHRL